jgi:hypothetical protein
MVFQLSIPGITWIIYDHLLQASMWRFRKNIWLGGLTGDDFWRMYTPSRSRKHELSRPTWSTTGKAIIHDVFLNID